jgi:hypothetical protein
MSDKYKSWQDRKPKKKREYTDEVYRGRKGKDRSNEERRQNKNWIKSVY